MRSAGVCQVGEDGIQTGGAIRAEAEGHGLGVEKPPQDHF